MEYGKIIAITGMPGLYELVTSKNDGAIVRSLDDKTTKFVSSRVHNFSHLETIEVYTVRENVNLIEIFKTMESKGAQLPDARDPKALKKYFDEVYPEIDFERVYSSDLKKMIKWYEVLSSNGVELKLSERIAALENEAEKDEEPIEEETTNDTTTAVKSPAKKATKAADKPKKVAIKKEKEEKAAPAKKAAKSAKKSAEKKKKK
jgi:hypothetical protein